MCIRDRIKISEEDKVFTLGGYTFHEGDYISLDGSTGKIYKGDIKTVEASVSGNFGRIMMWADKFRKLQVRTNADTPADTENAVKLGAEGIGLCRKMCIRDRYLAACRHGAGGPRPQQRLRSGQ